MKITDLALKNLWRRKTKAFFILAGLVIGVATVVAVITFADTMAHDITSKLEKFGANILVVPRTDALTLTYGGVQMGGVSYAMKPINSAELDDIRTIKNAANIAAVGPTLLGRTMISEQPVLLAGIDFGVVGILKPWWKIQGAIPASQQLIAGAEAARVLSLKQGQVVQIENRNMTVSGILSSTGSQDDHLVFVRLNDAQALLGKDKEVSLVEIAALCNACPIEDMVSQIAEKMPSAKVQAIQQVVKSRMQALSQFRSFSFGLSIVVVFIGGLVVMVTLMGSIKERTKEIGILRAVGFRQFHVVKIIFLETGFVSLIAGVIGYCVGVGSIWATTRFIMQRGVEGLTLSPQLAALSIAMALIVGLSASCYPAAMAARLDPNEALTTL